MSTNRHKTTMCIICGKVTRDDYLKRHMNLKHPSAEKVVQEDEENQLQLKRDVKTVDVQHNGMLSLSGYDDEVPSQTACEEQSGEPLVSGVDAKLKFEVQRDYEAYKVNVEIGRQISILLSSEGIAEVSLSKQNKFCLELFRSQCPTVDVSTAELRLWQKQLLDLITENKMNDRQIIWIKGKDGNEGKSWFQSYLQSLYGSHRVARFDITNKTSDLLHTMTRCALETTDIFLFNHQRCVSSEDCCYSLLEMIKDGYASAPKFHGSLIRIKKPNTIVIFSNRDPRIRSLSKDRWKIYFITEDSLTANHEEWMWEKQADDHSVAATKEQKKAFVNEKPNFY